MRNITSTNTSSTEDQLVAPLDRELLKLSAFDDVNQFHSSSCGCEEPDQCMVVFHRCIIDGRMFHSFLYIRRDSSVSYFVQYRHRLNNNNFGKIRLFFSSTRVTFALIEQHPKKAKFSELFSSLPVIDQVNQFFVFCSFVASFVGALCTCKLY